MSGKAARWTAETLDFDIQLRHVAGKSAEVALADYLSRHPSAPREEAFSAVWKHAQVVAAVTPQKVGI